MKPISSFSLSNLGLFVTHSVVAFEGLRVVTVSAAAGVCKKVVKLILAFLGSPPPFSWRPSWKGGFFSVVWKRGFECLNSKCWALLGFGFLGLADESGMWVTANVFLRD
jgi:hypothetical protein